VGGGYWVLCFNDIVGGRGEEGSWEGEEEWYYY